MTKLKSMGSQKNVLGMARFGISPKSNWGVSVTALRQFARRVGRNHKLAGQLWQSGIRDARILACFIDEPNLVTERQMEAWVKDLDSWDLCDTVCGNLFDRTPLAYRKVIEWSRRKEEFVKRAAFSLLAWLAVHDKKAEDKTFIKFLPIIKREASDARNYVRKAVNWALRNIGKRNKKLNKIAIKTARQIEKIDSKAAKWNAADALRELTSKKIKSRLE
ncbi:DNA alkylation repair protein [Candidatus Margulisiibacteriota bacterium]